MVVNMKECFYSMEYLTKSLGAFSLIGTIPRCQPLILRHPGGGGSRSLNLCGQYDRDIVKQHPRDLFAGVLMRLRRNDVEPELKFIHVAEHLVEFGAITGHLHVATILRLFQRDFFQDNFVQRVAIQ